MGAAFRGQQLVVRSELLLEYRNAECAPQKLAILIAEGGVVVAGQYNHRVTKFETELGDFAQFLQGAGDGGRSKSGGVRGPSRCEHADQARSLEARRENGGSRRDRKSTRLNSSHPS